MQTSEFYYGLPQDQWDILLATAEDLLREEDMGTHLVGLYPAGNRIYGIESEPPGILCLYVDTVESLINPSFKSGNPTGFRTISYGSSGSPIIFANLFDWAKHILSGRCGWMNARWLHVIPFASDIIYQDDSLDDILELLHQYMHLQKFFMPTGCNPMFHPGDILFHRADAILANIGKFYPCINPAWGKVCTLDTLQAPTSLQRIDIAFRNALLDRGPQPEHTKLTQLSEWLQGSAAVTRYEGIKQDRELAKQIGERLASLYRFTL
jgi:hypothetical protein